MQERNPINIRLIDHVVIRANDLPKMIDFYCDVLGCRIEKGPGESGLVQLRAGNALIDILDVKGPLGRQGGDPPDPEARNMDHFCVQVEPWDEDAILGHLEDHGVAAGEVVTRYGALGDGPSVYIADPEGNTVETRDRRGCHRLPGSKGSRALRFEPCRPSPSMATRRKVTAPKTTRSAPQR